MYNILENINLTYENVNVLKEFNLNILENKINCILGPSGSGKTSALRIIANLEKNYLGSVNLRSDKISYVFQENRLIPWKTVLQNIKIVKDDNNIKEVSNIINCLELKGVEDKYPQQLSGGMKQRCAIGRAFYYDAPLLLMDEPFKSLDYDLRLNMVTYLAKLWEQKRNTIILVTHNIDEALLLGHQINVFSRKPTKVKSVYNITENLFERDITCKKLINIRNNIISDIRLL